MQAFLFLYKKIIILKMTDKPRARITIIPEGRGYAGRIETNLDNENYKCQDLVDLAQQISPFGRTYIDFNEVLDYLITQIEDNVYSQGVEVVFANNADQEGPGFSDAIIIRNLTSRLERAAKRNAEVEKLLRKAIEIL